MKRNLIRLAAVAVLLVFPVYNFLTSASAEKVSAKPVTTDLAAVSVLSDGSVADVEEKIEQLDEQKRERLLHKKLLEQRKANEKKLREQIESGQVTYRQLFKTVLIVGDSLMNGLETYDIIDSANMITKVSASLYHLADNIDTVINNNPKTLILHYGINMIEKDDSHLDTFISMYTGLIEKLEKGLPNTRIIISGIFPLSKKAASSNERFARVDVYNARLKKMCTECNTEYLDNSGLLPGDESYYISDGIHVIKSFYLDKWLPNTVIKLGL